MPEPIAIRFYGTGNAFADGGRAHACVHVTAPGVSLLLDCGSASLPGIMRAGAADGIDAVVVSHLHGDHFGGIPYLAIQQHFAGRTRPLTLAGPPGLAARLAAAELALYADFFGATAIRFPTPTLVLGAAETPVGGAMVAGLPVVHSAGAEPHGIRLRIGDRLIAYSGDAVWSPELVRVAQGADLFICEATNFDRDDASHLSYRTLMAHRDELACRRIVLTHLGSTTLAHLGELAVEHADDGTVLQL